MEQLQEGDYSQIVAVLENKIPQEKITKILMSIKKASDLQDHGDSPYTRPTFSKLSLLSMLIVSVFVWLLSPLYSLYFTNTTTNAAKAEILEARGVPSNKSFSFNIVLEKTMDNKEILNIYDRVGNNLLGKADVVNNRAYVVSSAIDSGTIKTDELQILNGTNADLTEDIKDDILNVLNKNISVNDSYLEFKSIDFGVDQVINIK